MSQTINTPESSSSLSLTPDPATPMAPRRVQSQLGMTLLEIMIVLAIIAAVMGLLVGPRVMAMFSDSKVDTTKIMLDQISNARDLWSRTAEDACPGSLKDLERYRNTKKTKDSWGQEIVMICGDTAPEGVEFGVLSKGPDKKQGTSDDIKSWED